MRLSQQMIKIQKRDGRIVPFDEQRIYNAVHKAFTAVREHDGKEAMRVAGSVTKRLEEIFIGRIPHVEQIQDIIIETLNTEGFGDVAEVYAAYRRKRQEIREAKYFLLYHNVKTKLTENALKVLESRYLRKDENGKIVETPQELFRRIAQNIASAEKIYHPHIADEDLFKVEEKFYRLIASLEFLPNSPTIMNAGTSMQQLSACFVLPVEDSMSSIFDAVKATAIIHQSGGGTGKDFSRLRPKGDLVRSTQGISSGPVSFMKVFDMVADVVKQGGKRRGAMMAILRVDHPDIMEFIMAKSEEGILQNFNISVAVTEAFMNAVKKGTMYALLNPRTMQPVKELDAREVFDKMVRLAWQTGDPGMVFIERMNNDRGNPTPKLGQIRSTNPCGEQPLLDYEPCNLGSIDVNKMTKRAGKKVDVDWTLLKKTAHDAVHFLDNVISMNRYPLPQIQELGEGNRRIGLGIMGWADLLVTLEIPYNSKHALELADKLMEYIDREAKHESARLARERGVFANFTDSVYDKPGGQRLRNCAVTTIAPTGTIGIIAGCSHGIEPKFALAYIRKSRIAKGENEWAELIEVDKQFEETAKREGFYSDKLMKEVARKGTAMHIDDVPEKWKKVFATAHDLSPRDHVEMQAVFQRHVDNAVSKTINFPSSASVEDVKEAYMMAWDMNCKGITIYRDESKSVQVLNIAKEESSAAKLDTKIDTNVRSVVDVKDPNPNPELPPGVCLTCN